MPTIFAQAAAAAKALPIKLPPVKHPDPLNPPLNATFAPSTIDFSTVTSGPRSAQVRLAASPSNTDVTAAIINDPHGVFRVLGVACLEWVTVIDPPPDPGELPPPPPGHRAPKPKPTKHREEQVVAQSDGKTPLGVLRGQIVEVTVEAASGHAVPTLCSAMLVIEGSDWAPVQIPVTAYFGSVTTTFLTSMVATKQSSNAVVSFSVRSDGGPATDVNYELWPPIPDVGPVQDQVQMTPFSVHVTSGATVQGTMNLNILPSAPVGVTGVNIVESAFNDGQRDSIDPPFSLAIAPGDIVVSPAASVTTQPRQTISYPVDIANHSSAGTFVFKLGALPSGLTLNGPLPSVRVGAGESQQARISLVIPALITSGTYQFPLIWSEVESGRSGSVTLTVSIEPIVASFRPDHNLSAGNVTTSDVLFVANSDGAWQFRVSVHDSSIFWGDDFAYSATFTVGNEGHAALIKDEVGAKYSGPPRNRNFMIPVPGHGNDPWIARNWPALFAGGMRFHLDVSDDLGQPFESFWEDLEKAFKDVEIWYELSGDPLSAASGPVPGSPTQSG